MSRDLAGIGEVVREISQFFQKLIELGLTWPLRRESLRLQNEEQAVKNQGLRLRNEEQALKNQGLRLKNEEQSCKNRDRELQHATNILALKERLIHVARGRELPRTSVTKNL